MICVAQNTSTRSSGWTLVNSGFELWKFPGNIAFVFTLHSGVGWSTVPVPSGVHAEFGARNASPTFKIDVSTVLPRLLHGVLRMFPVNQRVCQCVTMTAICLRVLAEKVQRAFIAWFDRRAHVTSVARKRLSGALRVGTGFQWDQWMFPVPQQSVHPLIAAMR